VIFSAARSVVIEAGHILLIGRFLRSIIALKLRELKAPRGHTGFVGPVGRDFERDDVNNSPGFKMKRAVIRMGTCRAHVP
jgi:hypothetical protein